MAEIGGVEEGTAELEYVPHSVTFLVSWSGVNLQGGMPDNILQTVSDFADVASL